MKHKRSCGEMGDYQSMVPMPIKGRVRHIDPCIAHIVAALNAAGIETVSSCCGHGRILGSISLSDGTELILSNDRDQAERIISENKP